MFAEKNVQACSSPLLAEPPRPGNPCQPSPCGPNSECRDQNGSAACSCLAGYKGAPPACRPECVLNTHCPNHLACIGQKCLDPCQGECGQGAQCTVVNHKPVCRCEAGLVGDPYRLCRAVPTSELFQTCDRQSRLVLPELKIAGFRLDLLFAFCLIYHDVIRKIRGKIIGKVRSDTIMHLRNITSQILRIFHVTTNAASDWHCHLECGCESAGIQTFLTWK